MGRKINVRTLSMTGVFSALVFAGSQLRIPIPGFNTRLHLGNVMCLLSGFVLGPGAGGFAAGFGSALYDLTDPAYIASMPFTFAFKFAMAWLCGKIAYSKGADAENLKTNIIAATSGAMLYVVLYLTKSFVYNYVFLGMELPVLLLDLSAKALVSVTNGLIATAASIPLNRALRPAIKRAGFSGAP